MVHEGLVPNYILSRNDLSEIEFTDSILNHFFLKPLRPEIREELMSASNTLCLLAYHIDNAIN